MAFSKSTVNYGLPQYEPTDKPKYLSDFNETMEKIDTTIKSVADVAEINENEIADINNTINNINIELTTVSNTATTAETTATTAKNTADDTHDLAVINHNILHTFFEGFKNIDNWTPDTPEPGN